MKPAYDKLGADYTGHSSVLIGDVDCTVYGDLCQKHGVKGYPTIKYYTDETGKDGASYSSGRDAASLKKFAEDTLEPKCTVADQAKCSDKEKGYIVKMKDSSAEDLKAALERLEKMKEGSMKPELKQWVTQRVRILKDLTA
mmetsp:Transcript_48692/g.155892  ORF Transcript_48692/g.155892 Transcript_48692/m.155892 type:complete len:141 (+) Transcript_48692:203-625(+)